MDWESFTPWSALLGGGLIGTAASVLLVMNGRVAGISGVLGGVVEMRAGDIRWRVAFLAGLGLGGLLMFLLLPDMFGSSPRGLGWVAIAGALVGVGTKVGNGCTSGHGVCGLSRLSVRSLVATSTFMATGVLAASTARWVFGDPS